VPFTTNPFPLILPPTSVQTVRLSGVATQPGDLVVRGVHIRLADGSHTDVLLPIPDDTREKKDKRQSSSLSTRDKRRGIEARWSIPPDMDGRKEYAEKWLECHFVEEMPLFWIKRSSLTHGTVMLYDGERWVRVSILLTPAQLYA
jgi:hypothetical protein